MKTRRRIPARAQQCAEASCSVVDTSELDVSRSSIPRRINLAAVVAAATLAISSPAAASVYPASSADSLPRVSVSRRASAVADSLVALSLSGIVASGDLSSLRRPGLRDVDAELLRLYQPRRWAALWSASGVPTSSARAILLALSRIDDRGLSPAEYDVSRLISLAASPLISSDRRAEFDVALSVATLRTLRALYFGRVALSHAHPTLHITRDSVDLVPIIAGLVTSSTPDVTLDAAEPRFPQYQALKRMLGVYRERLIVDPSLQARVTQIEVTLERWRWLPRDFPVAPVIVNIPAFGLDAWKAGGDSAASPLQMNVVAGSAGRHQTPMLADTIRYIDFAPYWIVPQSIVKAELMPLAMRDPYILTVNNYEIVNRRGHTITPSLRALRLVRAGHAFIRQLPGGTNSLGKVKFMFPNVFDVYLHDSPVQSDFQRARRDQSHGCVRVSDPRGLAMHLLREQSEWTPKRIDAAMNGRTPTRVALTHGVPIFLFYATAVAGADGTMEFHDDIYGFDAALAAQLARGGPYAPDINTIGTAAASR